MPTSVEGYILLKPDAVKLGAYNEVWLKAVQAGLTPLRADRVRLNEDDVRCLYPERMDGDFERTIIDYMTSGDCIVARFRGVEATERLKEIKGKTYESGLRLKYADNFIHNSFHCPDEGRCLEELDIYECSDCLFPRLYKFTIRRR